MTTTDLVIYEDTITGAEVQLSVQLIRNNLCKSATETEALLFLELCRHQGLNPWVKDAYLIKYSQDNPATMVTGKDAFMKRADAHPQFAGMESGVIVLKGEHIENRVGTLVLSDETLIGGWARVARNDRKIDVAPTVSMKEFDSGRGLWKRMPAIMIEKCAIVTALRRAFPSTFAGMYDAAEMQDVEVDDSGEVVVTLPSADEVPKQIRKPRTKKVLAEGVTQPDPPKVTIIPDENPSEESIEDIITSTNEMVAQANSDDESAITCEGSIPEDPEDFQPENRSSRPLPCTIEGHGDGVYEIMKSPSTGQRRWVHDFTYDLNGESRLGRCVYEGDVPVPPEPDNETVLLL